MQHEDFPIQVKEGTIETAVQLSRKIPEFSSPHEADEYGKRFKNKAHLILVAYDGNKPVGFKAGYEREGYFYSWMGGVLPAYRNKGIAQKLADEQETWARQHKYPHVTFKTRNRHRAMLVFAIKNGFQVIGFEKREDIAENRILLRKFL